MRPPSAGGVGETALSALADVRARVAFLNEAGVVVWSNRSWSRYRQRQQGDSVASAALGTNYVSVCRRSGHPAAAAIAEGLRAVLAGASRFFELDFAAVSGPWSRRSQITASLASVADRGALVLQVDVAAYHEQPRPLPQAAAVRATVEAPTAREQEVLTLMARGRDNVAIAGDLGVSYVTVRAHVRSLMAKLGARSRLQAVVRGIELGFVPPPSASADRVDPE